MILQSKLVKIDDSAAKFAAILKANTFTSGAHVDYFD